MGLLSEVCHTVVMLLQF